jgi:alpha-beta hydrolase superfamily lysophospholipase
MTNPLAPYHQVCADIARPESPVFHIDSRWSPVRERPAPRGFLKAITAWGRQAPQDLGSIRIPVLIANGDQDKMVPSSNIYDLARRTRARSS